MKEPINPINLTVNQIENIVEKNINAVKFNEWRIQVLQNLKEIYKKNTYGTKIKQTTNRSIS
jgi:hypothetical protein